MSIHNPKEHSFKKETLILKSNHLGEVVEVYFNKEKGHFYGIKEDGTVIEHER